MATTIGGMGGNRPVGRGYMADQGFFTRYTIILALLILFGFIQFELRGFVDIRALPAVFHFHGAVMVGWLALIVTQNLLIQRMQVKTHRKLGWVGAALALLVIVTGAYVGRQAIALHIVPSFFTNPQFLALTHTEVVAFGLLVTLAILRRRETQWHRRLMLASTIQIVEPALGRLLPMPLMGDWGEWTILAIQLVMLAILARHDRKMLGAVHPATMLGTVVVVASHVIVNLLVAVPAFAAYAEAIAAG